MVSAWYPVPKELCLEQGLIDYMPPRTARYEEAFTFSGIKLENGTLETVRLQTCRTAEKNLCRGLKDVPAVLFSTGFTTSRHRYNVLARQLASAGYGVITIDHPYDAAFVEFPDGTAIPQKFFDENVTLDQLELITDTRRQDISFILRELTTNSTLHDLFPSLHSCVITSKVPVLGHSLGGAAALAAAQNPSLVGGAANLDGSIFSLNKDIDAPVLLFGSNGHNRSAPPGEGDDSWAAAWPHFRGWKTELDLQKGPHSTFSDLPFLIKALNAYDRLTPEYREALKWIDGYRSLDIVTTYLDAFIALVAGGKEDPILRSNRTELPEVIVVP